MYSNVPESSCLHNESVDYYNGSLYINIYLDLIRIITNGSIDCVNFTLLLKEFWYWNPICMRLTVFLCGLFCNTSLSGWRYGVATRLGERRDRANFSEQFIVSVCRVSYKVHLEVTNKTQAYVRAHLLQIEMAQGEDTTPTHTRGLETRNFWGAWGQTRLQRAPFINSTHCTLEVDHSGRAV
jgi:hypothetical protein